MIDKVIQALGLNEFSAGEAGWLFSLLSVLDTTGGNTYTNPVEEVLHRMKAQGVSPPVYQRCEQLLNTLRVAYASGQVR